MTTIPLGYEVGSGEPVAIPLKHMAVTGMTQEAGKTTTLEALISRSGLRAVAFITKRGEGSFAGGTPLQPYFRERADWVFVASLIDATMGEKNKMLRSWLMKVCRNTKTLAEVQRNVRANHEKARGFAEGMYEEINGYLELVVPEIEQSPLADHIKVGKGLNVMDLSNYSTAMQGLVIRSVLEHVYQNEDGVVTVIPEAWEFLPEGRGSPVKLAAETLIRKGAGLRNYIWVDSQDLAGVWKLAVRAAAVCLIGVQREANEIKRTLANIPGGIAKPKATDIATLELGQFYACWGIHAVKTYVRPAWMTEAEAQGIAAGTRSIADAQRPAVKKHVAEIKPPKPTVGEKPMSESLEKKMDEVLRAIRQHHVPTATATQPAATPAAPVGDAEESLYQRFKCRLIEEAPAIFRVLADRPEIDVEVERHVIKTNAKTLSGRLAILISRGFINNAIRHTEIKKELERTGTEVNGGNLATELRRLVKLGFLTDEAAGYQAVKGMKVRIVEQD